MGNSLPISLIAAWVIFFGFVNTHQRHAMNFRGASQGYHHALQASVLLGSLVGLGLLVYYFMQVAWYSLCANISGTLRLSSIRVAGGEEYPS